MTRFYSEYELKKQEMKLNEALFENTEKYKEDLKKAINEEIIEVMLIERKKSPVLNILTMINFTKWY